MLATMPAAKLQVVQAAAAAAAAELATVRRVVPQMDSKASGELVCHLAMAGVFRLAVARV